VALPALAPTAKLLLGVLPATLIVIVAGLLLLIALPFDKERRKYAIDGAKELTRMAAVLVGQPPRQPRAAPRKAPPQLPAPGESRQ
jgi:hypothetical protein